jgi:hypothetical protein
MLLLLESLQLLLLLLWGNGRQRPLLHCWRGQHLLVLRLRRACAR